MHNSVQPLAWNRQERLFLVALTLSAAFLRFYRLGAIPPGFHFDQAFYVFDAVRLLQGDFSIFFAAPGGSEPLYPYLITVGVSLLGVTSFSIKIISALFGTLLIPLVYGFARTFLKSQVGAAVTAGLATISVWLIYYSRDGERIMLEALMTLLALWFFWRGLNQQTGRNFTYAGIMLGIALYTYPAARVVPIILALVTLYFGLVERARARALLLGLTMVYALALLIFLPLGIYFFLHPDQFLSHSVEVSLLSPTAANSNVAAAIADNGVRLAKMFFIEGDSGLIRNIPRRPVFDPFAAILFLLGLAVLVWALAPRSNDPHRLKQKRAVLLLCWLGVSLAVSLVSDDAPNFGRMLHAAPAVMTIAGWGALAVWERVPRQAPFARRAVLAALVLLLGASSVVTVRDYLVEFGRSQALYYAFDADKVELANWIQANSSNRIFLAPLYYQQGTLSLLTRTLALNSFESRDTIILPGAQAGQDAVYLFPPEQAKKLDTLANRLGALGARGALTNTLGAKLVGLYRIPANALPTTENPSSALKRGGSFIQPQQTLEARWQDGIELVGYSVDAPDPARRNLQVTLFFYARATPFRDYTFSVKASDNKGRVWGQEDKWTGDNSFATTQWRAGDLVIERFYPGLDGCAPAGNFKLTVEAYQPGSGQVLPVYESQDTRVELGDWQAKASTANRLEDLNPATKLTLQPAPGLALFGYSMTPDTVAPDSSLALALFWQGSERAKPQPVGIYLRDKAGRAALLGFANITPPPSGRGLCSWFNLSVPSNTASGLGALFLNDTKLTDIEIKR